MRTKRPTRRRVEHASPLKPTRTARAFKQPGGSKPVVTASPSFVRGASSRRPNSHLEGAHAIVGNAGSILSGIVRLLARCAGKGLAALFRLATRSRASIAVSLVLIAVAGALAVDAVSTGGRVYSGVTVGDLDVGGMTVEEAEHAITERYAANVEAASITVLADEESRSYLEDIASQTQEAAIAEQVSLEEARANKRLWTVCAADLGAFLPADDLAQQALAIGRGTGGLPARIHAALFGAPIAAHVAFAEQGVEQLAADIDATIGDARVDATISYDAETGAFVPVEGHDGALMDRSWFVSMLNAGLLAGDPAYAFVAAVEPAPSRTSAAQAEAACKTVNAALERPAQLRYRESSWEIARARLAQLVRPSIQATEEGSFEIVPVLDADLAKAQIFAGIPADEGADVDVRFSVDGEKNVTVLTSGVGSAPLLAQAAIDLQNTLFGEDAEPGMQPAVELKDAPVPESMGLQDALDLGIVTPISSYTTEFSTYTGTENRNRNIALCADLIDGSIAQAHGGLWSFNDTAGNCNEERGFLAAGTIVNGEYVDGIGGGICQVATTVFNAVYEAGLPVERRSNHSLYISSYPAGRDAAVSWPDLDLVWKCDLSSDVLLRASCADASVTVTLYSAPVGYHVDSTVGAWQDGAPYRTIERMDAALSPGVRYVKTTGVDGRSITVVRTVTDVDGNVIRQDAFGSTYAPKNEIVMHGPEE